MTKLYDKMKRTGAFGGGSSTTSQGFSASRYFSRNATSADRFMPPPPSSSGGGGGNQQPLDVRRPYAAIGKTSVNLFGTPTTPPSPGVMEKREGVGGMPILGPLLDVAGGIGNLPWGSILPGGGPQMLHEQQEQAAKKYITGNEEEYLQFARQSGAETGAVPAGGGNWLDDFTMRVNFARKKAVEKKDLSQLQAQMALTPIENNLGGVVQGVMGGLQTFSYPIQRTAAGFVNRTDALERATDEELENNEELIRIRDEFKASKKDEEAKDKAIDDLTVAGYAWANPLGQADQMQWLKSIGDNTWLDLPPEILANVLAAGGSLGLEAVSDPSALLSIGAGTAVRQGIRGGARVFLSATKNVSDNAIERAIASGALKSADDPLASTVADAAVQAFRRELGDAIPEGVKHTDMNLVRYGLQSGNAVMQDAIGAATRAQRPFVANQHVIGWIQSVSNALDPISLFGGGLLGRTSNKALGVLIVDGMAEGLGKHNIAGVMDALEGIGVTQERSGGDLGVAAANMGAQVGNEGVARNHSRLGIDVTDRKDPTIVSDLASGMLRRHGQDVRGLVKHKVAKMALLVVPRAGETMQQAVAREREFVADLITKMYGVSVDQARVATAKMSPQQLAVVRFMQYGNMADNLLTAREKSYLNTLDLSPEFIDRIIFLGPTQLTTKHAKDIRKAIKKGDIAAVKAYVEKYDILEWNINLEQPDSKVLDDVKRLLDNHKNALPTAVPPDKMPPAMQAFKDKFGDSVEIGLRSEEVYSVGRTKGNRIVSIDPFVDYIRGAEIGVGDVKPENIVKRNLARLTQNISGSQVVIEQNRRFAQHMAEHHGMSREQSDIMMTLIRAAAGRVHASTARGLSKNELWEAIDGLDLPPSLSKQTSKKELQRAIFFAHEGSLGVVGLSQKATGMLKSATIKGHHVGAPLGMVAERMYPLLRFRWNAFFQLQEGIETPVLLLARGMISPHQFSGPLTGTRVGAVRALRAGKGGRKEAFRVGREAEKAKMLDIEYQTAVMMDAYAGGIRYAGDMVEATNLMVRGSHAASVMASTREGRALTSLLHDGRVARIKTRGQLIAFRKQVGDDVGRMLKQETPVGWDVIRGHYFREYGVTDDSEVAVRWYNDLLMRNDPESAFSAVLAQNNPGEFFRPGFLGRRTRWSDKVVMHALRGEMVDVGEDVTFKQLRKRYNDPKDTVINERWLEERLRAVGADEWYIQRTKWRMDYQSEKEFEQALADLSGSSDEAAAWMDYHRTIAADEGIPLIESLADKYHSAPMTIDENGVWKPTTMFQLITDAFEARGIATVPMDHPSVVVGGYMSTIGAPRMPDISLPEAVGMLAWEDNAYAATIEMVPLSLLKNIPAGNNLRMTPQELKVFAADLKSAGIREPVIITYYHGDGTAIIDEGNHRLAAALLLLAKKDPSALEKANIPVRVHRSDGMGASRGAVKVRGAAGDEFGHVNQQLRPSDIGIGTAESASIIRNDTALMREMKVKELTAAQVKARRYTGARAARVANPELGTPPPVYSMEGGRLVARNADGQITHRIGGVKSTKEWVEELRGNMTDDEMKEHAEWYIDMRRGFMALSENQQEQATYLLMAFGVTQLNTSPIAGMKFMWHVVEAMKGVSKGKDLPEDLKQLTRVAGLNGENLTKFMHEGYISDVGMGQKLIDFVDSLLGVNGRTVPVRGPDGTWTAAAGDIWAKRDVGYVDGKMLNHLKTAYGEEWDVVAVGSKQERNEDGEMETVAKTFRLTNKKTGQIVDLPTGNGQPTDLEYDHILEFYNEAASYLNQEKFLGRTNWVAAEAQALGWFKAKKVMGDETGDPRSAYMDSAYSARLEVGPSQTAVMRAMYPELGEETSRAVGGATVNRFNDEATRISGTTTVSMVESVVIDRVSNRAGAATNIEVMASPDGIRKHLATLGALAHQARVRATRATTAKPTKANNVRPMIELSFPSTIHPEEMRQTLKALAEDAPDIFGDADLVPRADGTKVIRVVANVGESEKDFALRVPDHVLRDFYSLSVSPHGYARGRYINPDEPMGRGVREQKMKDKGELIIQESLDNPTDPTWLDDNFDDLAENLWTSVHPDMEDGWGGSTWMSHDGTHPKGYGGSDGGPFATGITQKGGTLSFSLDEDTTFEEFKEGLRTFIQTNRGDLSRHNAAIGIFRDQDPKHNRIDVDVNLVVETHADAEAVQLHLDREGGAYDFTTGQGVYSPVFDPKWSNDVHRGYAEVIEMENDWEVNPNGEGYTAELRKPYTFIERQPEVEEALDRVKGAKKLDQGISEWVETGLEQKNMLYRPDFANTVQSPQKGILIAYDAEGNAVGQMAYTAQPGGYGVLNVMVKNPRQGIATRLYDEAYKLDGDEFFKAIGQTGLTPSGKKFATSWLKSQKKVSVSVPRGAYEDAAGELEREGVQWGRMVHEDAYQRLAARETTAHRIARGVAGDPHFDVSNPAGYLQSSPRGTRSVRTAAADAERGTRLFYQRAGGGGAAPGGGAIRGAITDPGAAVSTTPVGKAPRRAQVHISPRRKQDDTIAHEQAHDFINRYLDESGRRRAKAVYAGREGTPPPKNGAKRRSSTLTVDEQEWLADQLVEYLRQGDDAVAHPALRPLAAYYKKTLKSKADRVPPDTTVYDAATVQHQADMASWTQRKAAHDAERAAKLNPQPPPPPPVSATFTATQPYRELPQELIDAAVPSTEFAYHTTPVTNLDGIQQTGLVPSKVSREDEPAATYFASSGRELAGLVPRASSDANALLRVKRGDHLESVDIHATNGPAVEYISRDTIPSSDIEFFGEDGQWHPLTSRAAPATVPPVAAAPAVPPAAAGAAAVPTPPAISLQDLADVLTVLRGESTHNDQVVAAAARVGTIPAMAEWLRDAYGITDKGAALDFLRKNPDAFNRLQGVQPPGAPSVRRVFDTSIPPGAPGAAPAPVAPTPPARPPTPVYGPLPEGAQLSPEGYTDRELWDALMRDNWAKRDIKPGEEQTVASVLLSDEDYARFVSTHRRWIRRGSSEDVSAYNAGYASSQRSQTADLDAASSRFAANNPGYRGTEFERGWADASNGNPKDPPPKRDMITVPAERPELPPLTRTYVTAEGKRVTESPLEISDPAERIKTLIAEADSMTGKRLTSKQDARMMEIHEEVRRLKQEQAAAPVDTAEAEVHAEAIRAVYKKHNDATQKSPVRMEADLDKLEAQGVDVTDERIALEDYTNIGKTDYDDIEDYRNAREDAWNELLDAMNDRADTYVEDFIPPEAPPVAAAAPPPPVAPPPPPVTPAPVDIGEFPEPAPVLTAKKPRGKNVPRELHPEAKALFDTVNKTPVPVNAHGYDVDEQAALNWMYAAHRRADRTSKDLIHFRSDRSWLERSLNHPYFGLYPLSYMWGKVLPEMVEFLAFKPFGFSSPLVGLQMTNKLYQHTMHQLENDPELREWMAENEDMMRAISMLIPGVPWDLPVNAPLWLRRYIEGVATNLQKEMDGEKPEDWATWKSFVEDIDYARIVGDTVGYALGPKSGLDTLMSYPELGANVIGGMGRKSEEELAADPDFRPPVTDFQPPVTEQQQVAPPPAAAEPEPLEEGSIEQLTSILGDEYAEVAERISNGE